MKHKLDERHLKALKHLHENTDMVLPEACHKHRRGEALTEEEHDTVAWFFAGLRLPSSLKDE